MRLLRGGARVIIFKRSCSPASAGVFNHLLLIKILTMFVVLNIIKGEETRLFSSGYFYACVLHTKQRFCTPVWRVNAPTALEVLSNGKGRAVLYFCPNLNFSEMLNTENQNLSVLKENWAVAEVKVSYIKKQRTNVFIKNKEDAYKVFLKMWDKSLINLQEQFAALYMNNAGEVIAYRLISTGTIETSTVDLQFILTCGLACRAQRVIVAHNHPSGSLKPSLADLQITTKLLKMLMQVDIDLDEHLIITDTGFVSIYDENTKPNTAITNH